MRARLWKIWSVLFSLFVMLMVIFYFSIQEKRVGVVFNDGETRTFSVFRPLAGKGVVLSMQTAASPELLAWLEQNQRKDRSKSCEFAYQRHCVSEEIEYPFTLDIRLNKQDAHPIHAVAWYRDDEKIIFEFEPQDALASLAFWPGWPKLEVTIHDTHGVVPQENSIFIVRPALRLWNSSSYGYQWLAWMFFWPIWLLLFVLFAGVMELIFWLQRRKTARLNS
ncbi:hypothetical protein L0B52_01855 [Suttonella sp. R2A3]|uniref:hypothetical protein n=1 Tax=Suttonella sp. R2A3 TaxID=2908648 RepID=UPI001F337570|nr:hypothetical protein [Suttonella sp. R2A3]UJF24907.1 hypothetical protein L0B52_01855 [Suttonella sp. R2A3]